ncbi:hypothetical protein BBJ28_00007502 [Nothophytophthora sp. Chile5]|nr:hypothetical protein BBJ28_00007502 [Nothophytophthora sp. Chile5]
MRHRHHRQYGLPNANQILLTMVVCTLLFFALLRRHWLQFGEDPDVHAGLQRLYVHANDSAYSQTWSAFCDDQSYELHIPETSANTTVTVGNYWDGAVLCAEHGGRLVPAIMQILLALSLSCALLSVLLALYLQLGNPTRELIFWLGTLPSITLMATGAC